MATEANIQDSVCLKKGEREENAVTSEIFEEKITELPGNQVKQLEPSSQVAETVNTPLETGKPTDESGIFFQALSVPTVIADKHSTTPESCKAAKQTEPEEEEEKIIENEEKVIESEACGEDAPEKAEPEVGLKLLDSVTPSKKEGFNLLEKNQGDSDGVTSSQDAAYEDIKETTTEHATTVTGFKEHDLNETPREFVKEKTEGKSVDAQEASEQCENGSKDTEEQKSEEIVKKIVQDEEIEEIKADVKLEEKGEQNQFLEATTSDAAISTQTKSEVETTEHEEEDTRKSDNPLIKEVCEENSSVNIENESSGTKVNEKAIPALDKDEEKEQDVSVFENDQDEDGVTRTQDVTVEEGLQEKNHHYEDNEHEVVKTKESIEEEADVGISTLVKESIKTEEPDDGVTSSQESPGVDVEETTTDQQVTTAIDYKEQDLNEKGREFIKEETKDKPLDAPETSEESEKGAKEEIEQNPEESDKKIEKEEETEEIKPGVEIEEQDELFPEMSTDVCIPTETKSQVEKTEHEEEDTQKDDGLKETSDSPSINEVCEKADSAIATVTKNEDEEKEQEVNVLEKDEGKDDVASAPDVTFEKDLQEKNHHNEDEEREVVTAEKSIEKDTEDVRSSEETEQQKLINVIPSDVCISTETEPEEETTEKNDEEAIETGQGPSATHRGIIIQEAEDKSFDAQEETEQKLEESVNETTHARSTNEQEVSTEGIKPEVETTEEKDVSVSTQTESQEEATKNEGNAIESDGDQKEKSNNPFAGEVCEENDIKQTDVKTRESVDEDTEETKSSDVITADVGSTEAEHTEKTIDGEENNDDSQKEKPENPLAEVVCEATSSEIAESEEEAKHSDSFSTTLNADETLSKEEKLETEDEIKTSEVQGDGDEVTSSQHASNEDIKETTIGQHDTTVAYEEGKGVSALPKETLIEEAVDKSIDVEEVSLKLGQTNEQNVEETISQNAEDEIKKEEKDLSHENVEDTNDDTTKEEKCILEHEPVEEHSGRNEVSKEIVTDLNETTEVEPQEHIKSSTSFETSAEDTSNSEKEKAESENLPIEDRETVSEVQIPEIVPKSEDSIVKEECIVSETETHLDEEKRTVTNEISSADKREVHDGGDDVTSSHNASNEDIQETTIGQHDTNVAYVEEEQSLSATPKEILIEEAEDKSIDVEETSLKLGQPNEQNVEETISQNLEDEIKKEDKDLPHESVEDTTDDTTKEEKAILDQEPIEEHSGQDEASKVTDLNETIEVEPQEDITPSTPFKTSTEDASNSEKEKAESENLPTGDLENVSEVQLPELVPKSEDSILKEEYFTSETETHLDEEKGTITKEISSDEKIEVQGGGDDVTSSQNASNEDIQETTIGQHDDGMAYVEEEQGLSETPKEILTEAAEDKSIDAEEISLELGQPNEQIVEETLPCLSETISENPEDEIKKENKELSHESVEDENDSTTKEEKGELEQKSVEEHSGLDEVSKEIVADLNETTEAEPQEDLNAPSISLETSTEDTSNSEKEKAETENLPLEDLETVSEVQIPELVPKSEESVLKEECFTSETKTHLDEENGTITKETSSDEKIEVQGGGDDVTSSQNASNEDIQETTIGQHDTTVAYVEEGQGVSATPKEILIEEAEDKSIDAEETSLKPGQPNEQNVEDIISQNPEDEIKKEDKDLSYESVEDTNDDTTKEEKRIIEQEPIEENSGLDEALKEKVTELNETTEVEPQEDITPSISLKTSTEDISNSEKENTEIENLPMEDLETVSEVQIPESVPKSEESVCFISETETHLDEEKGTVTEEISSDEKTEPTTEIKQEIVKEVCEETISEKVESEEGLKLSDSSNVKINEKEITFKEDDGEKDQKVNKSTESQGEDNITSSLIEVSEEKEYLKEKNYHNEDNEGDFIESGKGVDEDIGEIKSSVEIKDNTEHVITTSSSTEIEPVAETIENEEKNDEKAIENDEDEIASKEENLEKKQDDIKEIGTGGHATTVAYFEEEQSLGTVTKEVLDKEVEEGDKSVIAQKETDQYDDGENDEREQKPEENTDEIKPSVVTNEEKDVFISTQNESQEEPLKNEENVIEHDGDQKEKSDNPFVKEVCEERDLTKTESEERELSDSFDVKTREIVDEDTEETKFTDVSGLRQTEKIEKTTASEENNDEENIKQVDGQIEKPQSPLGEVACEAANSEIVEYEEGVKHCDSFSTTLDENEIVSKEEILEKEDEIKTSEVEGGGDDVTSSQYASNEDIKETIGQHDTTVAHVEEGQGVSALPKEILVEEAEDKSIDAKEIPLELGEQNVEEAHPCLSETVGENPEDEIKKDLSHESVEDTNDNTTEEEKGALEHEPVEHHSGLDEVLKENVTDLSETTEAEPQEDITPSISLETSTEDTSISEKEKIEIENLQIEDLETVSEVQILESVPKSEEPVLKEEHFISETETHLDEEKGTITEEISSDEKKEQTTEIQQETVKEVCEETSSEKAELKLSDTSDTKINEKEITSFKDSDQEKDQEVNISTESRGEDSITSSQIEVSEEKEYLQEKNDHNEGNEGDFIKSEEGVHEDAEEIKSSVETKENAEHVIITSSSTQIEPDEETTEKNGEKAIENDENEIISRETNLENKLEDVCSSAQTEPKEETVENKETVSELQGGVDDVISSQNASNEDTTETPIGQHATTTVHFEEGLGVNKITKEITGEEVEDKSTHAQEAIEEFENEAKDKIEQQPEESENSCSETIVESAKEAADAGNKEIESKLEVENQADIIEDRIEIKDEVVLTEKVPKELEQTKEQNVEEIEACLTETVGEKTEDEITKDEDLSHDSIEEKCFPDVITKEIEISTLEHEPVEEQNDSQKEVSKENFTDLNETTAVEPQEDITPSGSLETSTEDTANSDKAETVNKSLPIEDLESISEVHTPEIVPKPEDSKTKDEFPISETATATYVDEEIRTVTKEISSYENLETHGSTQQPENSYNATEENVTQLEQIGEINSLYESKDIKGTQDIQLNSTEGCSEVVKDVVLTEEIEQVPVETEKEKGINDFKEQIVEEDSYSPELEEKSAENQKEIVHEILNSDSIPAKNPEVTEVSVEDISCVSKVTNDVDQEPKEEGIPSLEDAATVDSQVDLSNIESTTYPSEGKKLATRALESDYGVQIPKVVVDSEDLKVKEECIVLETAEYTDENSVEEKDTKTNEISSAPDKEHENVTEAPTKSDEVKSSDLIIEEKALTKENLEIHGEPKPISEPVIEEDQVTIETKSQPEQSDITCENITNDQNSESKLEHESGKYLEDGKGDVEEDVALAPENEITSIENLNETTKNIILTDKVVLGTEKEKESTEIERQVSEEDNCPTELDNTSTPDQKESTNELEYSKPIPDENTEVTEAKTEGQIVESIQAAENLSSSKASSIIETSKVEMHEDTERTITVIGEVKDDSIDEASKVTVVPVLEDSKASELQFTGRELVSELQTFSEEQKTIEERCIEEEAQGNSGVEIKDAKSEYVAVEDVIINEVIPEDEKAKESKSIKDIINEEAIVNQLTSDTDEVCQIEKSSWSDELIEAKDSVEDTEDAKFMDDNLNVKDETLTVIKGSNEDSENVASEFKRLEDTVTEKEKETLDEPQADDSAKTTSDSILSSEIATELAEIVPECKEASSILTDNLPEASPELLLAKHEDKITEDPGVLPSIEKDVIDVQKHEKDIDHETEIRNANVLSDVECSEIEPRHLDTKEATLEFNNQENQKEQKKEADESIEDVIPVENVKTSTREPEVGNVDLEVPYFVDATVGKTNNKTVEVHEAGKGLLKDDEHIESAYDQSKPTEEGSGIKQEPLELDAPGTLGTAATEELKISQKYVTDDLIKVSQTHPEIQAYEPNEPHPIESTETKILTAKTDSSHDQGEPVAKSFIPETANLKADTVFIDQKGKSEPAKGNSEVAGNLIGEKEETGVKTDEEYEEEEDNEDDEKLGSCSEAPVMVEASKDIEVKAHKKSHNILSGVGSKVKHSIAKVKKAITGKSTPPKSPSPKAKP